jgi:hypothetical protein
MRAIEQDFVNDLATAARKFYVEQVAAAGYLMCLNSNGIEISEERIKAYTDALNKTLEACYVIMRQLGRKVRSPKVRAYSKTRKCDLRCTTAKGDECSCACGSINHGIDRFARRRLVSIAPGM